MFFVLDLHLFVPDLSFFHLHAKEGLHNPQKRKMQQPPSYMTIDGSSSCDLFIGLLLLMKHKC